MIKDLNRCIEKVTAPIYKQRGFAEGRIISDWAKIVGAEMALRVVPVKINYAATQSFGATLHVHVSGGAAALELQHEEHIILEKIATYFGYRAVNKLNILQAPVTSPDSKKKRKRATPAQELGNTHASLVSDIEDDELKKALTSLGKYVIAENNH